MSREMVKMIEAVVVRYPDVTLRFEHGGKHRRAIMAANGRECFVTFTDTRTDSRGMLNKVAEVRRICRELGA